MTAQQVQQQRLDKRIKKSMDIRKTNPFILVIRLLSEPFLMAVWGYVLAGKVNAYIRGVLQYFFEAADNIKEEYIEEITIILKEYFPSVFSKYAVDITYESLKKMLSGFLILSTERFVRFFLAVAGISLGVCFLMIIFWSLFYRPKRMGLLQLVQVLLYKEKMFSIPFLIGVILSALFLPLGIIPMIVAIIMGGVGMHQALVEFNGPTSLNGATAFLTFLVCEVVKIILYLKFWTYVLPKIFGLF